MRRPVLFAAALSAAFASPAGLVPVRTLRAEKPRVADAVASFLDSLTGSPSRSHGPSCGCGSYVPQPEPTCEAAPFCGVEPTCGVDAEFVREPVCGIDSTGGPAAAFGADAFVPRVHTQHVPVRMRIQSHPPGGVDRSFAPAHRLPPAPKLPSVEREPASPATPHPALVHPIPAPEPMPEPPVASMPLPVPEPMPEPMPQAVPMPDPEPMPEPEPLPVHDPEPMPKNDPVQAAPLPRPKKPKPKAPAPAIEEPEAPAPEESTLPTPDAPKPKAESAIPTPTVEPLPTSPSAELAPSTFEPAPTATKLTPEPRRQAPSRPLSNSLPYDPTDPFADPPAPEAPTAPATPTSGKQAPAKHPEEFEIPRFGEEEFAPVGTGVVVQPTSGVETRTPAVRPALRIVPVHDLPLSQAR